MLENPILIPEDVEEAFDRRTRAGLAARELGWIAYAGVPLVTDQGYVVGALSVMDTMPRLWSERDVGLLQDLAASAVAEIELRGLRRERSGGGSGPGLTAGNAMEVYLP